MEELEENPDGFRLFVEAWVHAQARPASVRGPVAAGMDASRATFKDFAEPARVPRPTPEIRKPFWSRSPT